MCLPLWEKLEPDFRFFHRVVAQAADWLMAATAMRAAAVHGHYRAMPSSAMARWPNRRN